VVLQDAVNKELSSTGNSNSNNNSNLKKRKYVKTTKSFPAINHYWD
jgi:hypothetical protein